MDHAGFQCQYAKAGHTPNVTHDQAHTIWRACMKGQHKTLPDGTVAGMGWILANNLQKATYVIDKNQKTYKTWKAQQRTWQGGAVYEKSQVKTKQTCSAHNKLYPTTNNSNYFALIAQNDDDEVTVIGSNYGQNRNKNEKPAKKIVPLLPSTHHVQKAPNAETMLNASNIMCWRGECDDIFGGLVIFISVLSTVASNYCDFIIVIFRK